IILCNLIMFFAWAVCAYMIFFSPKLEAGTQTRQLESRLQAMVSPRRNRRLLKMLGLAVVTAGLMGALFWINA
ncbi:MAG: hypothetical protein KC561_09945, partial [Myxococcales bacterium]|nr:hypothetical protein [Myxococcales bacterium]